MNKALEIWSATWAPDMIEDDYAKKRIKSAQSQKLTPILIDRDDLFGYFQGSHGKYETFLDTCPCGDFRRANRPCKHIFRLAMELGVLNVDFQTDSAAVPAVRKEQMSLNDTVDVIEGLSDDAQRFLLEAIRKMTSNSPRKKVKQCDALDEVLRVGILVQDEDPVEKTKYVTVLCSNRFNRLKIHKYLHRKYDNLSYMNSEGNFVKVPLLETILPDDDVTMQLIDRGYGDKIGTSGMTSTGEMVCTISLNLGGVDD